MRSCLYCCKCIALASSTKTSAAGFDKTLLLTPQRTSLHRESEKHQVSTRTEREESLMPSKLKVKEGRKDAAEDQSIQAPYFCLGQSMWDGKSSKKKTKKNPPHTRTQNRTTAKKNHVTGMCWNYNWTRAGKKHGNSPYWHYMFLFLTRTNSFMSFLVQELSRDWPSDFFYHCWSDRNVRFSIIFSFCWENSYWLHFCKRIREQKSSTSEVFRSSQPEKTYWTLTANILPL